MVAEHQHQRGLRRETMLMLMSNLKNQIPNHDARQHSNMV